MLVFRTEIHKLLVRIVNKKDPDQTASSRLSILIHEFISLLDTTSCHVLFYFQKYTLSPQVTEDEIYFFKKPIIPQKVNLFIIEVLIIVIFTCSIMDQPMRYWYLLHMASTICILMDSSFWFDTITLG